MALRKVILKNRPEEDSYGQYTYGNTGVGEETVLGIPKEFVDPELELHTAVQSDINQTIRLFPNGKLPNSKGSSIEIIDFDLGNHARLWNLFEGFSGYRNCQVAVYMFDDSITPAIKNASGTGIRDLIGEGNNWGYSKHCLFHWILNGNGSFNSGQWNLWWGGALIGILDFLFDQGPWGGDASYTMGPDNVVTNQANMSHRIRLVDFPEDPKVPGSTTFVGSEVLNTNWSDWIKHISGEVDSSFYIIIRAGGDQWEYSPIGHGWTGLEAGHEVDELPRCYYKIKIPKKSFFESFYAQDGSVRDITFDSNAADILSTDSYGGYGHSGGGNLLQSIFGVLAQLFTNNDETRLWNVDNVKLRFEAPTWEANYVNEWYNFSWVDTISADWHLRLRSDSEMDFTGFNPSFYYDLAPYDIKFGSFDTNTTQMAPTGNQGFFNSSLLRSWRPITEIDSGMGFDVQAYYEKATQESLGISAPMDVNIKLKLAEDRPNFNLIYWDDDNFQHPIPPDIFYGFYVANWDWKEGDPETLEEIIEANPQNVEEAYVKQVRENTHKLKILDKNETDWTWYPEEKWDTATNHYRSAGTKIIKIVVFSHMYNQVSPNADSYVQPVDFKLLTSKINLTVDKAFQKDYFELGGRDFVFLPYPDVIRYDYPIGCDDLDLDLPNCDETLNSSHPIISGLSADSQYINSLTSVVKANQFSLTEQWEKALANKSLENSPGEIVDEFGDYLGETGISQVRYFKKPFDMNSLLMINDVWREKYTNFEYWDGQNNLFPSESCIGTLFIDDNYNQDLKDTCLIELNCSEVDGLVMRDSSGNGNVGILLGDYTIQKDDFNSPTIRDSFLDLPTTEGGGGAF